MNELIAIVDDEPDILDLVALHLKKAGFRIQGFLDVIIDLEKYEVRVEGKLIDLTSTEFRILKLLASKRGWVFTRHHVLDYLWGHEKAVLDRTVDVHIRNLREKLGDAGRLIKNIRGVAYKLEP